MPSSYLKVIMGPMFSSKSSSLLSEINRYKYITDKILVINSILDKERHSDIEINQQGLGMMKTHDNKTFPAIMLKNLEELHTNSFFNGKYNYAEIVIIDEAQFYPDLYDFLYKELHNLNYAKRFIVAGLSSDFNMSPIGDIIKIIPMADDIIKLSALCVYCKDGTPANFTKLIQNKVPDKNILVGAKESYLPCCRFHFLIL